MWVMPEQLKRELEEYGHRFWHKEDWREVRPLTPEEAKAIDQAVSEISDGDTITNESGGKQSFTLARFDYVPPETMILLAECLGFGGKKYGKDNWRKIPMEENIAHAMLHLQRFRSGDRSEPHMVNAFARVCFALSQAVASGDQPGKYDHPEIAKVFSNG